MPALFFPNPDALRLALAAGIVPSEVARESVRAGADDAGRVWVEPPPALPRDSVAGLTRIGVQLRGQPPPLTEFACWAQLLPARPRPGPPPPGPVLFEVPDTRLAGLAAEIRRLKPQSVRVRLLPSGRAWLLAPEPPTFCLPDRPGTDCEAFTEQSPNVWVAVGWRHPLDAVAVPPGVAALVRPGRDWTLVPLPLFEPEPAETTPAIGSAPRLTPLASAPVIPVTFRLRKTTTPTTPPTLWVLRGSGHDRLEDIVRDADERILRRYQVAVVRDSGRDPCLVLRTDGGPVRPPELTPDAAGWVPYPGRPTLHLPAGHRLEPAPRPDVLDRVFGSDPGTVSWLEPEPAGGFTTHQIPASAFRPLSDRVGYATAPPSRVLSVAPEPERFDLPRFGLVPESDAVARTDGPPPDGRDAEGSGWLARSLGRLLGASDPVPATRSAARRSTPRTSIQAPAAGRVGGKLASPHSLAVGNEWAVRRSSLEQRILSELPVLGSDGRANLWAELAEVYTALGHPADAAVCWVNAIWERDAAPPVWLAGWAKAEARAARFGKDRIDPTVLLAGPATAVTARAAAAYLAWAAAQPSSPSTLATHLPRLLALIDAHEPDLPKRGVWLARLAASRLADRDALGLARCRDRLFRRLADHGPGLDLDAPSFLRFYGANAGRFLTARDWLTRVRDPLHRWLGRVGGTGRLQGAGLDAETRCTEAYADLMLAWGLSKLGDRTRAKDLETAAAAVLADARGAETDRGVHRSLLAAFRARIRDAQDGRPDRSGPPTGFDPNRLDDLGRYAVDKLRSRSRVLEPLGRVNPYRGHELRGLLGTDALGDKLAGLFARASADQVAEVLAAAVADPTAATVPRVALALLELAPGFDPPLAAEVMKLAPAAVELAGEWVRTGLGTTNTTEPLVRFTSRLLAATAHAAALFHRPEPVRGLLARLATACQTDGQVARAALSPVAGDFFRAVRTLGLGADARDLLAVCGPPGPFDVGLAVGWFAAGDGDAANRVLDATRERLLYAGIPDDRERTVVALGYAAAVGHAPPRVALGRLEELFLRLDAIAVRGATNRYFTLQPLELIDTVVCAVVSDEFAVGPGVCGWLDDDEFLIRRRITRDVEATL